jgi:hypothetical protein
VSSSASRLTWIAASIVGAARGVLPRGDHPRELLREERRARGLLRHLIEHRRRRRPAEHRRAISRVALRAMGRSSTRT